MTRDQFISLVESTQKAFRRFLVALCCGDAALADDIAQESYIKAYLSFEELSEQTKFNAWIFKIGYNAFLNHRRGVKLTIGLEETKDIPLRESADAVFAYQDLYEALNKIPAKERMSVLLHYMRGYSIKEIACIQDTSIDSVKQYLSRGRRHLRGLLSAD